MKARRRPLAFHTTYAPRFSRRWWLDSVRTLAWVAVITALVWVYADVQFTDKRDFHATLRVSTAGASDVTLLSPAEVPIAFSARGNRYSLDTFGDRLALAGGVLPYDAARALEPGFHQERAADILASLPEIRDRGLEIVSAQPGVVEIMLDRLKLVTGVPVKFEYTGGELAEPAKVEPDHLDLRAPVSRLKALDLAKLALSTEPLDLRDIPAGETVVRDLEVVSPVPGGQLSPRKVKVSFKVRQQIDTRKFTVPVQVKCPEGWLEDNTWQQYKLLVKDPLEWTRQLTVQGNRADLEKLKAEDLEAYIILTDDDKRPVDSWLPGEVKVNLPGGGKFRLLEPPAPVSYRLVKRVEAPK